MLLNLAERFMDLWHDEATFHHEVMWALVKIFTARTPISARFGKWDERVCSLARDLACKWQKVAMNHPQRMLDDCTKNAQIMIIKHSNQLLHADSTVE